MGLAKFGKGGCLCLAQGILGSQSGLMALSGALMQRGCFTFHTVWFRRIVCSAICLPMINSRNRFQAPSVTYSKGISTWSSVRFLSLDYLIASYTATFDPRNSRYESSQSSLPTSFSLIMATIVWMTTAMTEDPLSIAFTFLDLLLTYGSHPVSLKLSLWSPGFTSLFRHSHSQVFWLSSVVVPLRYLFIWFVAPCFHTNPLC